MASILTQNNLARTIKTEDLFKGLSIENANPEQKKLIKNNSKLENIISGFKKVLEMKEYSFDYYLLNQRCNSIVPEKVTNLELNEFIAFALGLQNYENFGIFMGLYTNSLIQNIPGNAEINLKAFTNPLHFIGYKLKDKNICIKGDVGSCTGDGMENCTIVIEGNCKTATGRYMKSGKIEIHGNTERDTGVEMNGGEIKIFGNAGNDLGHGMNNGKIIVHGNTGLAAGCAMNYGEIRINGTTKRGLGEFMNDGKIFIEHSGEDTGYYMVSGKIIILKDYLSISTKVGRGNIYYKGKTLIHNGDAVKGANIKWN